MLTYLIFALQILAAVGWFACFVLAFAMMARCSRLAAGACVAAIMAAVACVLICIHNLDPRGGLFTYGVDMVGLNGAALVPLFAGMVFAVIAGFVPFIWCLNRADGRCKRLLAGGTLFLFSSFALAMIQVLVWLWYAMRTP
jgi:hypothetical protein